MNEAASQYRDAGRELGAALAAAAGGILPWRCDSFQHVRVKISNLSASLVTLTAFVRLLPHVCSHLYLKTWCMYAREALTVR